VSAKQHFAVTQGRFKLSPQKSTLDFNTLVTHYEPHRKRIVIAKAKNNIGQDDLKRARKTEGDGKGTNKVCWECGETGHL
jgi:hypothetical protein